MSTRRAWRSARNAGSPARWAAIRSPRPTSAQSCACASRLLGRFGDESTGIGWSRRRGASPRPRSRPPRRPALLPRSQSVFPRRVIAYIGDNMLTDLSRCPAPSRFDRSDLPGGKAAAPVASSYLSAALLAALFAAVALQACGGGDDSPAPAPAPAPAPTALTCDDSMKAAFKPDANTTVLLVKSFKKGDPLLLTGTATGSTPIAANDLCFVKLQVGPGNPGPASAPSTSAGIGIEVWLPTAANWNTRIHNLGGGGWAGGNHLSLTAFGSVGAAATAGSEGSVVGTTDTGHSQSNGTWAMRPDGTISTALWTDFVSRSLLEAREENQVADGSVLPPAAEVGVLGWLLHGRAPRLRRGAERPGAVRRVPDRCTGSELDPSDWLANAQLRRVPARPQRRSVDDRAGQLGQRRGGECLRHGKRPAPRLYP